MASHKDSSACCGIVTSFLCLCLTHILRIYKKKMEDRDLPINVIQFIFFRFLKLTSNICDFILRTICISEIIMTK